MSSAAEQHEARATLKHVKGQAIYALQELMQHESDQAKAIKLGFAVHKRDACFFRIDSTESHRIGRMVQCSGAPARSRRRIKTSQAGVPAAQTGNIPCNPLPA
jgi:hypothetical protein